MKIIPFLIFSILSFQCLLSQTPAKYEPAYGCYVGAFIVNDTVVKGNVVTFEALTGKDHSMYFSYTSYGQPFPSGWVNYYSSNGAAVQIAFEPLDGLAAVQDGDYIRQWARAAKNSGAIIFLRWACEMNGNWVPWYGNPSLYIEKFRLMHRIMKEEAPNVAMVWAPNDVPNDPGVPSNNPHSYYPGDEYVDWVGIDFYGVYYYENGTPERNDPRNKLRVVYDVYSNRKPIIICEWAAAHYTTRVNPPEQCTAYCIDQMNKLYLSLQTQFPKVKAVCWFDMNSLTTNKCNFALTENSQVLSQYRNIMQLNYFISSPFRNVPQITINSPTSDTVINSSFSIYSSIICNTGIDSVICTIDNIVIGKKTAAPYYFPCTIDDLADGRHTIRIFAYSSSGFYNSASLCIITDKENNYLNNIIDDSINAYFQVNGSWLVSVSQPDRYGAFYHVSSAGDGSNKAFWYPAIGKTGMYNIYAFWSEHSNRASNAPYIVHHNNTTDTVRANQRINGGKWNLLGTFYFDSAPENKIEINNKSDGYVIADAIRYEWAFISGLSKNETMTPSNIELFQNYPNPFNNTTKIEYSLREAQTVEITVYDILGNTIEILLNSIRPAGTYSIDLNATRYNSGVYFYEIKTEKYRRVRKMILIK